MRKLTMFVVFVLVLIALPTLSASALNFGSGTFGSCQYNTCSITLSSDVIVNLDVTPQPPPGTCTVQNGVASVLTDDSNGFTLTLGDASTNTALVNGSASIPAESGTFASPASLQSDTWGYRVDGAGSFGSGPTTVESNSLAPSSTPVFAAIEASNQTADTIANTSTAADPAVNVNVFYGACADTAIVPGEYSTAVTYTAVTN